jgi:DNA invertase Pin-like site-specific DNA recombinase
VEHVATTRQDSSLVRAAEYVRMSTDRQKYSTANQSEAIRTYAAMRGMMIVRTYSDEARSGLNLKKRPGLMQLIADVQSNSADFSAILVYDVSRWGRFQDSDESGYYEYLCKRAGIVVHYCAEQFENDGSSFSAIIKNIKRAMAAEYSRELSVKVFAGQSRLVKLGYRAGGSAPYGLRRLLVDQHGTPKEFLAYGERKSIQTDRVLLVPGASAEIEIVRWVFETFAKRKLQEVEIARRLNEKGLESARGAQWASHHVCSMLTNENYIGNLVWNRQSLKLKGKAVRNHPTQWIRASGAIEPIIERRVFERVQAIRRAREVGLSQEEKLNLLRRLLRKHGTLSIGLINNSSGVPHSSSYARWFGSIRSAYKLVGFTRYAHCDDGRPRRTRFKSTRRLTNEDLLKILRRLHSKHGYLSGRLINTTPGIPSAGTYHGRFGSISRAFKLAGLTHEIQRPPGRATRSHNVVTQAITDDDLLNVLQKLLETKGSLTASMIDEAEGIPCAQTYQNRFGSLTRAYQLIGYYPGRYIPKGSPLSGKRYSNQELSDLLNKMLKQEGRISARLLNKSDGFPTASTYRYRFGNLRRACARIGYKLPKHRKAKKSQ